MRVNLLCAPTSRELPSGGGSADAPRAGGGAGGAGGVPFTLGACGALEKLGAGGSPNDGAAPSEGGDPRSAESGGRAAGGVMPNEGTGSGAGDRYESEKGVRGRSAAGVLSIFRGISGARKGIGGAKKGDPPFDPAAGDIRWKSCVNSPGCAGSLYETGGAIGFGGALSSEGCGGGGGAGGGRR